MSTHRVASLDGCGAQEQPWPLSPVHLPLSPVHAAGFLSRSSPQLAVVVTKVFVLSTVIRGPEPWGSFSFSSRHLPWTVQPAEPQNPDKGLVLSFCASPSMAGMAHGMDKGRVKGKPGP